MLKLSKQSDYALIILSELSREKKQLSLSDLISRTHLPKRFLARIASILTNNDILKSKEGKEGGYTITSKAFRISLYEFLQLFETHLDFIHCSATECAFETVCKHKKKIQTKLSKIVIGRLKQVQLKEFIL